jgi:hypothetical protein
MRYGLLLLIFFMSCIRPREAFEDYRKSSEPDYSKESAWAALPMKKDSADLLPPVDSLRDEQANAAVDVFLYVFFIYPTIYYSGESWNADIGDEKLNKNIQNTTIKSQASVFNGSCKIYAPYYRQATLYSFMDKGDDGAKALQFAYADVKKAFDYYLAHYNKGRPIIVASHSQGTYHAKRLMKEYFDQDSLLRKKLVVAYLVGGPITKNFLKHIPPCNSATQCNCYVAWNSRKWGGEVVRGESRLANKPDPGESSSLECINPLTWKHDTVYAAALLNKGSLPLGHKRVDVGVTDCKCTTDGTLWVHPPDKNGYPNLFTYHIFDYSFFWMNIRENVRTRVDQYFKNNK